MFEAQAEAAVAAALSGGAVLLAHFRRLEAGSIDEKTKNDFVSVADRESETAVREVLDFRFPQYGFLGEEGGASGDEERLWIVDPLDGTLNFIQGFPHWCVSVALWDAEGAVTGCIYDPLRDDLFLATRGKGATWIEGVSTHKLERPMHVSTQGGLDGAFLAVGFAYQLGPRFPEFMDMFARTFPRAKGLRRAGSAALDMAHTAAGIFDGFFELGLKKWDIAAGALLLQEAGGRLSDWQGGETWWETGDLLCGTPGVHADLVELARG
ncbi:MAG TPA: inositol monophosphatase family protein [Holophagaceae bacterium]|nr:inositol monophosphatase family protein [Holophagaceae bacterium]